MACVDPCAPGGPRILDRTWRHNDILWGRLDGAERIIAALLPGSGQQALRDALIDEAHRAILLEYLPKWMGELEGSPRPSAEADRLRENLAKVLDALAASQAPQTTVAPPGAQPRGSATAPPALPGWKSCFRRVYGVDLELDWRRSLRHLGRASKILSSMLDGLRATHRKARGLIDKLMPWLTRGGNLILALVEISMPQGWAALIFRQWLKLLGLLAVAMLGLGLLLPPFAELLKPGGLLLVIALAAWVVQDWTSALARRFEVPRWVSSLARILGGLGVLAVLVIAATIVWGWPDFADLFWAKLLGMLGFWPSG